MARVDLLGPDYNAETRDQIARTLVNMYLEEGVGVESSSYIALPTPGLKLLTTIDNGVHRVGGSIEHNGLAYFVVGNGFYEVNYAGVHVQRGTLSTSQGPVKMAAIENEIVVVDGVEGYSYLTVTKNWAVINDADFPDGCSQITALRDYFIAVVPDSQEFFSSDITTGRAWTATSFAAAEIEYDKLLTAVAENNRLWLLGEVSTELWVPDGSVTGAPFSRSSTSALQVGIAAVNSAISFGNQVFWLGRDKNGLLGVVVASSKAISSEFTPGEGYQILSTAPMLQEINDYYDYSTCFTWVYQRNGHTFVNFTFPNVTSTGLGKTWSYDLRSKGWNILESLEPTYIIPKRTRHKANNHVYLNGRHLIGDHTTGNIYELVHNKWDENGESIRRVIRSRHISVGGYRYRISNLRFDVKTGVGLDGDGPDTNPQVQLRISRDRGHTWDAPLFRYLGKIGEVGRELIWGRLGMARYFTFEVSTTDKVEFKVFGMNADIEAEETEIRQS